MFRRFLSKLLPSVALAALLVFSGCSVLSSINPFGGGEEPLTVTVAADSLMNNGTAARVFVYQLSGDANFQRTPLEVFWQDDRAALGDELVGERQQVSLYPGEQKSVEVDVVDGARYLGVAANLREPESNAWRRVIPLAEITDRQTRVQVERDRLSMQAPPASE